jgi:6-pyruvoyl-tetrahydropterin synthase
MRLKIRHNMEMAHRLSQDTTKCKQIHGHGMQVEIVFMNLQEGPNGMAQTRFGNTIEFGQAKRLFRAHIDSHYDHRLVLNEEDPWAGPVYQLTNVEPETTPDELGHSILSSEQIFLPGLTTVPGEPTVENLAKWIGEWAAKSFECDIVCRIDETKTNGAEVYIVYTGTGTRVSI